MNTPPLRLLLVDDHAVLREGIRALLEYDGFATVVAVASSVRETLHATRTFDFDVAVLDMQLPDGDGTECTRQLLAIKPTTRILVLSQEDNLDVVRAVLDAGAHGYILKTSSFNHLRESIQEVSQGKRYVDPIIDMLLRRAASKPPTASSPLDALSPRERDVLMLASQGKSTREICEILMVSHNTLKTHLASIYRKLDVSDRTQAVLLAVKHGITAT